MTFSIFNLILTNQTIFEDGMDFSKNSSSTIFYFSNLLNCFLFCFLISLRHFVFKSFFGSVLRCLILQISRPIRYGFSKKCSTYKFFYFKEITFSKRILYILKDFALLIMFFLFLNIATLDSFCYLQLFHSHSLTSIKT